MYLKSYGLLKQQSPPTKRPYNQACKHTERSSGSTYYSHKNLFHNIFPKYLRFSSHLNTIFYYQSYLIGVKPVSYEVIPVLLVKPKEAILNSSSLLFLS